jgi:soluble lytic murein transglycosylase-like protein
MTRMSFQIQPVSRTCPTYDPAEAGSASQPAPATPSAAGASAPPSGTDMTPQQVATTYASQIQQASDATGVPKNVLAGMIWQESKGHADEPGGGLMQVSPDTFSRYGGQDINDPSQNIMAGAKYLQDMSQQFGDIPTALRAYNSGPNNVDPGNLSDISKAGTGDPTYVDKVLQAASESGA